MSQQQDVSYGGSVARKTVTNVASRLGAATDYQRGLIIRAHKDNTQAVAIGFANTLTVENHAATDGFPLFPGDTLTLNVADLSAVWAIAVTGTQVLNLIAL